MVLRVQAPNNSFIVTHILDTNMLHHVYGGCYGLHMLTDSEAITDTLDISDTNFCEY